MSLQGKLFIVTEFAAGGNLHDFVKRQKQKLPEELVWRLYIQVSDAADSLAMQQPGTLT